MADANKTSLTRQVTELAAQWLAEKGFKPVETEVPVGDRWIADIAGAAVLTPTEAISLKMVPGRPKWSRNFTAEMEEWGRLFRSLPTVMTAVIEVKTSRSDFTRDDKFAREPASNLLYLACPSGLVKVDELPSHVGLIYCDGAARCVRHASLRVVSQLKSTEVVYSIGVRRDHFTAYERFREMNRQSTELQNERSNKSRLSSIARCVMDIAQGKRSAKDALCWYGVKVGKTEQDVVNQLERFAASINRPSVSGSTSQPGSSRGTAVESKAATSTAYRG